MIVNPKGRVRAALVKFVSFVKKGANRQPLLYKNDDGRELAEFEMLVKADAERGEVTAVMYVPEQRDVHGTIATAEAVRSMCHSHARAGSRLDIRHNGIALKPEDAYLAESFIIQKNDERFADWKDNSGKKVDVTGSWAGIFMVDSPEIRGLIKSGEIDGVSILADALVELNKSDLADDLSKRLRGEITVDKAELATLLKENNDALIVGLAKALAPAPAAPPKDEAPKFTGDPSKLADVQAHQKALERHLLVKGTDFTNPEAVAALATKLAPAPEATVAALEKQVADGKAANEALQKKLDEARKGSNQPEGTTAELNKSAQTEQEIRKGAREMMKRHGYAEVA